MLKKHWLRLLVSKTKSGHIRSISIINNEDGTKLKLSKDKLPTNDQEMEELNNILIDQYWDNILLNHKH